MRYQSPSNLKEILKLNGEPLQRDDLHYLYVKDQLDLASIGYLFGATAVDVYHHMMKFHLAIRKMDYYAGKIASQRQKANAKKKEVWAARKYQCEIENEMKRTRAEIEESLKRKKPELEYYYIGGKRFSNKHEHNGKMESFEDEVQRRFFGIYDKPLDRNAVIRNVDLSAMRLHRGLDMMQFSQKSGIPYKHVVYYEKTPDVVVPKEVYDTYFRVLDVTKKEFRKILDCLSGKRKSMYEEAERTIPTGVMRYVWNRDGGRCRECGKDEHLHYHHKTRFSDGGQHQARNLMLLCISCHTLEHYGEPGYGLLKGMADKLGVTIDVGRKANQECV